MKLSSLGYKSQLIFTDFDGKVDDRGTYLVVRSLTNPNFFWGNLLIFNRAPAKGDCDRWIKLFKKEFTDPRICHVTLAWDPAAGEVGKIEEFLERDFTYETTSVLSATAVKPPPKFNSALEVRPLYEARDWQRLLEIEIAAADDHLSEAEWRSFYVTQNLRYRAMIDAGLGQWFGGFLDGQLVGGLGIFHRSGLGRFQIVCTAPEFQRQGICGTLVYHASQFAFKKLAVKELVMCADPDYHAIKIYESVGFQRRQSEHGVCWWEKKTQN